MKNKLIQINKKLKFQNFLIKTKDLVYYQRINKKLSILQMIYLF